MSAEPVTHSLRRHERAKANGAYYTDERIAAYLTAWAIRDASARVLDPSFGGGAFLEAAADSVRRLGGNPALQVFGVELDPSVHEAVSGELAVSHGIDSRNLIRSDFFDVEPDPVQAFDAVVGNPPFIRYQSFSGASRAKALSRASQRGVELSSRSSSWAPFLVHSCAMVNAGGRLAMVLPMELGHAAYARPVLDHLARTFARVTLLTFRVPLFPDLSQDTLLLLADGRGEPFEDLGWRDLDSLDELAVIGAPGEDRRVLDHEALSNGDERFVTTFIDGRARDLYRDLAGSVMTSRLEALAQIGIGYVTGSNRFFHLSPETVARWQLPSDVLSSAVFRGRALQGLTFTEDDWSNARRVGSAGYLLDLRPGQPLDDTARSYVAHGASTGVNEAYKCRIRDPWYSVPSVYTPDALLTYMSGLRPQLVENRARAVAPNTLHVVRLRPGAQASGASLALAWQSSLTSLSVEIEGHAMGGGMLKLEPKEAQKVVVPTVDSDTVALTVEVDRMLRAGRGDDARELVDRVLLRDGIGLSKAECGLLRSAAQQLRVRRYYRGRAG